jgi:surface-anchored protein
MKTPTLPFLLAAALLALPLPLRAASIYSYGHADIGLALEEGELHPHWHLDDGGIVDGNQLSDSGGDGHEYEAGDLIARIAASRPSAAGSADYLGVPAGTQVFVAGLVAYQPYIGFGAEELNPLEWTGDISVELTGFTTPLGGNFALYTTNAAGTSTVDVSLSTYDPSQANSWGLGENVFGIGIGGHDHYQFGFTAPGEYTLTLKFTGQHNTLGTLSGEETFTFQVVPEPGAGVLACLALVVLWRRRRG